MLKKRVKELIPDPVEVLEWFKAMLAIMSGRQLAKEMGIDPSIVNRNHVRMREGRPLTKPFRRQIEGILEGERQKKIQQKRAEDRAAAKAEADRQADVDRETESKRTVERQGKTVGGILFAIGTARRMREEEEEKAEQRKASLLAITPQLEKLREMGILTSWDEDNLPGDAGELVDAGVTAFPYVSPDMLLVALAPDDYVFPCGLTAAQLRKGVTAQQRLQPTAVPEGQPRPLFIGVVPASYVYRKPLPGEIWRHGERDAKLIVEQRSLTQTYGHLASGRLPLIVSPETAGAFERLIEIEETSDLEFKDSVLGPDARDRLKRLQRRAIAPAIGAVTGETIAGAVKGVAGWTVREGWQWALGLLVVAIALSVAAGIVWGVVEGIKLAGEGFRSVAGWIGENKRTAIDGAILLVLYLALAGLALWWVWRKDGESRWQVAGRVTLVALLVVFGLGVGLVGTTLLKAGLEFALAYGFIRP